MPEMVMDWLGSSVNWMTLRPWASTLGSTVWGASATALPSASVSSTAYVPLTCAAGLAGSVKTSSKVNSAPA